MPGRPGRLMRLWVQWRAMIAATQFNHHVELGAAVAPDAEKHAGKPGRCAPQV